VRPLRLGANQQSRFYRGGEAIARFRGLPDGDEFAPEDWVGSTTTLWGERAAGLTSLEDGRALRQAVAGDPEAFLGPEHVERFGSDTALLVKLLDAGERLPVHCHPDRAFSRRHLDCRYGKTEAWVVVEARGTRPAVHLGFRREVRAETLAGWVARQETEIILGALHAVDVDPGDSVLVPAGMPHAIGAGVFVIELQEPADLSVLLEWEGFAVDGAADGHLGLGFEVALGCVDRSGWGEERLRRLLRPEAGADDARDGPQPLLVPEADRYFRAERVRPPPVVPLEPGFSILVVLDGAGRLETERGGTLDVRRGETLLVPWAAGAGRLGGAVEAVRCMPPLPAQEAP
jgi:mannose-6-phosphate isomerase